MDTCWHGSQRLVYTASVTLELKTRETKRNIKLPRELGPGLSSSVFSLHIPNPSHDPSRAEVPNNLNSLVSPPHFIPLSNGDNNNDVNTL